MRPGAEKGERTFSRKIHAALLARKLEQELTKDQILELLGLRIVGGG